MKMPFNLREALRAVFFSKDGDVVLQSGRTIVVSSPGVVITIDDNGIVITGGDVTIDGSSVSVSGHAHTHASTTGQTADDHHSESHTLASHTGQLSHDTDLTDVSTDDHHNEAHTVASHSDTSATGSELNTLTDGSDASTLHDHDGRYFQESEFDATPGAASKPLQSDSGGKLTLVFLEATTSVIVGSAGVLVLEERSGDPGTPATGDFYVYSKSGKLYTRNDSGTVEEVAVV